MSEQQQHQKFLPGDRVRVTMDLTLVERERVIASVFEGTANQDTVTRWAGNDHITVELAERPEPSRESGWYLCTYRGARRPLRWDGEKWRWVGTDGRVQFQDRVTVLGIITLYEGVEL